jgi:hypothetical protein
MKSADPFGGEFERGQRCSSAGRHRPVHFGGRHPHVFGAKIGAVETLGVFEDGCIAAFAHILDYAGHRGVDIFRRVSLRAEQSGKARLEVGGSCVKPQRHGSPPANVPASGRSPRAASSMPFD